MRLILNQAPPPSFPRIKRHALAMAIAATFLSLGMVAAFGSAQDEIVYQGRINEVIEQVAIPFSDHASPGLEIHAREVRIRRGDTIHGALAGMGISDDEALSFLRTNSVAETIFRQMAPGKTISALVTPAGDLHELTFPLNGDKDNAIVIQRLAEGFSAEIRELGLEKQISLQTATIEHSLFGAADDSGIPDSIATQLADIFGGDIDFHRDLRKGDRFSVIYETSSYMGKPFRAQKILAAEFINAGKAYRAFWYQGQNQVGGYYTEDGRNVRKAFLRSPLEFSRITSGFSNARYHPVLRETRAHRGIDYGAPIGTRVKATGEGVVEFAGVKGGYGKVIMVRHPGDKTTVYGHLSGFAPGIKKGSRVSQGDVIGYVGATGIATGPHLHYELRVAGVHRNPLTVSLPDAPPIATGALADFKSHTGELLSRLVLMGDMQLVMLD